MFNGTNITDIFALTNMTAPHILISILNVILIILILVGNCMTIAAISKFRHLQYPSNIIIGALAVADLLIGTTHAPIQLIRAHIPLLFELKHICLMLIFVAHVASISTVVFLSLLSLERFYAVQFPFHYHSRVSMKGYIVFTVIIFALIAVACIPMFAGLANWYDGVRCYAPSIYPRLYILTLMIVMFSTLFFGFLAFLRVCVAEFRFRRLERLQNVSAEKKNESVNTTCMLTAYTISLCLWFPHILYHSYGAISRNDRELVVFRCMLLLDLLSSAINCFLYAWKNSKFRHGYRLLLGFSISEVEPTSS